MADTWAGTGNDEFVEKQAAVDGESQGFIEFLPTEDPPAGWSTSDEWLTWNDAQSTMRLAAGAPSTDEWPTRAELLVYAGVTPDVAPGIPTIQSQTCTPGDEVNVTLSWNNHASADGAWDVNVYEKDVTAGGSFALVKTVPIGTIGGSQNTQLLGRANNNNYEWYLTYENQNGEGPQSTTRSDTTQVCP